MEQDQLLSVDYTGHGSSARHVQGTIPGVGRWQLRLRRRLPRQGPSRPSALKYVPHEAGAPANGAPSQRAGKSMTQVRGGGNPGRNGQPLSRTSHRCANLPRFRPTLVPLARGVNPHGELTCSSVGFNFRPESLFPGGPATLPSFSTSIPFCQRCFRRAAEENTQTTTAGASVVSLKFQNRSRATSIRVARKSRLSLRLLGCSPAGMTEFRDEFQTRAT